MGKGQNVDPQLLESAGGFVRDVAKDRLQTTLAALKQLQITEADFGRKHHGSFQLYKTGVEKVGKCVDSYVKASEDFGNNLGSASKKYSANEADSSAAVRQSGGK
ncbi:hypothetical protein [Amycolatopsis saalfeldensis]|uniref:Excreted virulence factor EspC, type VII ESX diderm n=1 Tax=Amycolatopsis saalfeldensis TaxID=394193 RepID=A0A1H8YHZ6_9PSEU|nr:hypothetical protein [Amycolatopsis saalfeldensis]SEP51693.1 hypothetical protein SAMN04489732_11711 [Amycolatopsis saalfeldensis]